MPVVYQYQASNINGKFDPTTGALTNVTWNSSGVNAAQKAALAAGPSIPSVGTSDGTWYWQVRACNFFGCSKWSQVWRFTLDTVPPTVSITSPASGSYIKTNWGASITIKGAAQDNNGPVNSGISLVWIKIRKGSDNGTIVNQYPAVIGTNGSWSLAVNKADLSIFNTGDTLVVQAESRDGALNNSNPAYASYTVDNVSPVITLLPPTPAPNSFIKGHTLNIHFKITDNDELASAHVGVKENNNWIGGCSYDNLTGTSATDTCSVNLPANADGTYVVTVSGSDAAGNQANWQQRTINVDNQSPQVKIWLPDGTLFGKNEFNDSVRLFANISDNGPSFTYKIELIDTDTGKVAWSGTPSGAFTHNFSNQEIKGFTTSNFPSGHYKVKVIVKDLAGNKTVKHLNFTIDNTAPTIDSLQVIQNGKDISGGVTKNRYITVKWS
ncbi:MAG: Ig-like domain-containing protein, partial [Candidatus Saccharimonadales bacterium]